MSLVNVSLRGGGAAGPRKSPDEILADLDLKRSSDGDDEGYFSKDNMKMIAIVASVVIVFMVIGYMVLGGGGETKTEEGKTAKTTKTTTDKGKSKGKKSKEVSSTKIAVAATKDKKIVIAEGKGWFGHLFSEEGTETKSTKDTKGKEKSKTEGKSKNKSKSK